MDELEKLRSEIFDWKDTASESLIDSLEELNEFDRGRYQGMFHAYDDVTDYIRSKLKYGE